MVYLGNTREKTMYFGAPAEIIQMARVLRQDMTEAEKVLWSRLRKKQLNNTRFYRQHPISLFIVDFYCHKYRLAIEVDGGIHRRKEVKERDVNKEAEFDIYDIRLLRFSNDEIMEDIEKVIEIIKVHLID